MFPERLFKETVKARAERDPAFRAALLAEGVDAALAGDVETGDAVLRAFIDTAKNKKFARNSGKRG